MGRKNSNARETEQIEHLPPEQIEEGAFSRVLQPDHRVSPHKRTAMIDRLFRDGKISDRQLKGLARYRDIVNADEGSPIKDSIARAMDVRGSGGGWIPKDTYAHIERGYLDRELGALRAIAYAIAFDDKSLSQWAMEQSGSVERRREEKTKKAVKVVVWFEPHRRALKLALADIRMAGERLAAAINA